MHVKKCPWCQQPSPDGAKKICGDCKKKRQAKSGRSPDPTPEEIKRLTAEIQDGWDDSERRKRTCYTIEPVEVKQVKLVIGADGSEL